MFRVGKKKEMPQPQSKSPPTFEDAVKAEIGYKLLKERLKAFDKLMVLNEKGEETEGSMLFRLGCKASLGHGKIGERYPIGKEAHTAYKELITDFILISRLYGEEHPLTCVVRELAFGATMTLVYRSIDKEDANVEIAHLPLDLFFKSWRMREDSLER